MGEHPDLPSELKRLAWLSLNSAEGQEYWAAMGLMGRHPQYGTVGKPALLRSKPPSPFRAQNGVGGGS